MCQVRQVHAKSMAPRPDRQTDFGSKDRNTTEYSVKNDFNFLLSNNSFDRKRKIKK